MVYYFETEKEIKRCLDCPLHDKDTYEADGCKLLNDYIKVNVSKEIDTRCELKKITK